VIPANASLSRPDKRPDARQPGPERSAPGFFAPSACDPRLAFPGVSADSSGMDTTTSPDLPAGEQPELDLSDTWLVVIVAPEVRSRRDFTVIREPDDTDEDYQSRCELVTLLLDHADKA
jgi:hypothetical protein